MSISTGTVVTYSPYEASKLVNAFLAEAGIQKVLPAQMFYTYVKKAYIAAGEDKRIESDVLQAWMIEYTRKALAKV
jgi:hypothetical protein